MVKRRLKKDTQNGFTVKELLLEVRKDVKQVKEIDIPKLQSGFAVIKAETSTSAKIISAIGGIIAVCVSVAVAYLK
jgi:hypothetical protein